MTKYCLVDSLIGKSYPFFLNNFNFSEYFLYQVYSPSLTSDYVPTVSLAKISENLHKKSITLSEALEWSNENEEVEKLLFRQNPVIVEDKKSKDFAEIEMKETNVIQKTLIVALRDALRWKRYKFYQGAHVDVMWSPDTFVVFKISGDKTHIWLEAENMYKADDVKMENPLKVDLSEINKEVAGEKWEKTGKASDINRFIKKLEINAFEK